MNPVIWEIGGIRLWYYGFAYALGFWGLYRWLMRRRCDLGWTIEEVLDCSLAVASGALLGGRAYNIFVYEWEYYRAHPTHLLAYWEGGMSTHGVLLGAMLGGLLFCWLRRKRFLVVADELVIPGALFMALGRLGNHINGEIYGPVTDAWWAVRVPYAEGLRHPVALYDAIKNLLIIPILLFVKRRWPSTVGLRFAHFIFWYGFLRFFIDFFREYNAYWFGIGKGQYANLAMALAALCAMAVVSSNTWTMRMKRVLWYAILSLCLTIPSGWSQRFLANLKL